MPTPDAANISSAVLIRPLPPPTLSTGPAHGGIVVYGGLGTLTVTGPPNSNIAPPGYYMLFILNSSGVPAVVDFVQLTNSAPAPPPARPDSDFHLADFGNYHGGWAVTITGTSFQSGATVRWGERPPPV